MLLITGANGQLGQELRKHLSGAIFLGKKDLNVCSENSITNALDEFAPSTILHLAAYTSVIGAESKQKICWDTNVAGTANLVGACLERNLKLIFISSDYVFDGCSGNYGIDSHRSPINFYGKTKSIGEDLVRILPEHLIVRTSFKPSVSQHKNVPGDMWTSADYIDVIAGLIVESLDRSGTIHVGTKRKRLLDLVRERTPDVVEISRADIAGVALPKDTSFANVED